MVVERGLAETMAKAQALILAGEVRVGEQIETKAGHLISIESVVRLKHEGPKYVSRGGTKLAGALDHFGIDPKDLFCLDVGASTGGFTDCLLQRGARHVFCVDVGRAQLDERLRKDPRVTWREEFHAKDLRPEDLSERAALAVVDVSFISLRTVLPFVLACLKPKGTLLALVKPQFEAKAKDLVKGVLKNEVKRTQILDEMADHARSLGLANVAVVDCVLPGPKGNVEAFLRALVG